MALLNLSITGDEANVGCYSNWSQEDWDLLQSQKGLMKIHEAFKKTPFKFSMNLHFGKSLCREPREIGIIEQANQITVLHSTNVTGTHRMPMNAWTMVHRMAHCIQAQGGVSESGIINSIFECIEELLGYGMKRGYGRISGFGDEANYLLMATMTMRSARKGLVSNELDFLGELLAQFVLCGKITLLRTESWSERLTMMDKESFPNKKPTHIRYLQATMFVRKVLDKNNVEKIDAEIEKLEVALNREVYYFLEQCVGKVLHF